MTQVANQTPSPLLRLPIEILYKVFEHLSAKDCLNVQGVSRIFYTVSKKTLDDTINNLSQAVKENTVLEDQVELIMELAKQDVRLLPRILRCPTLYNTLIHDLGHHSPLWRLITREMKTPFIQGLLKKLAEDLDMMHATILEKGTIEKIYSLLWMGGQLNPIELSDALKKAIEDKNELKIAQLKSLGAG